MDECYKHFGCKKTDCIMHGRTDDTKCWENKDTLCNQPEQEVMMKFDFDKCLYCVYYKKALKIDKLKIPHF